MPQRPWGAHSTSRGVAVTWRPRLQVLGLRPVSFRSGRTCSGRTRGAQAPEQHPLARSCVSAFSVPRRAFDCIPARPENFGDLADALTFVRVVSVTATTESPISGRVERLFSLPGMFSSRCLCRLFQVLSPAARRLLRIFAPCHRFLAEARCALRSAL